jgi:hypothetical protein
MNEQVLSPAAWVLRGAVKFGLSIREPRKRASLAHGVNTSRSRHFSTFDGIQRRFKGLFRL